MSKLSDGWRARDLRERGGREGQGERYRDRVCERESEREITAQTGVVRS